MKINIYKNADDLGKNLAEWICDIINKTLQEQEFFTLVLSGGNTPKSLYKKLASEEFKNKINWSRLQIFWGDERAVPFTDERNNAKMAYDTLLDNVTIPKEQIHAMRTDIEPVFAAKEYDKLLKTFFTNTIKSFDLVLLGMGDDGHTLSLFPDSPLIEENSEEEWVKSVYNSEQKMYRITLMPLIVNRSAHIAFMVDGSKKATVLKEVIEGTHNPLQLPSQIIQPVSGNLYWFLDKDAAEKLKAT